MNYGTMSAEEISLHFGKVSRQRMSQIIWDWRDDAGVSARMIVARGLVNGTAYEAKWGMSKSLSSKTKWRWQRMNDRCNNISGRYPAYSGCTVGFESHKDFAQWSEKQLGYDLEGYELDKDILVKGNTVYSRDTCTYVPTAVNGLMVGSVSSLGRGDLPIGVSYHGENCNYVAQMKGGNRLNGYLGAFSTPEEAFCAYKVAKEAHIKRVANAHKHLIDAKAYDALMNYVVEITD